jgi:hypothetical protein
MGWVYLNETDDKEAVNQFELAVNSGNDPDKASSRREAQRLVNVKKEALVDLAFVYPNVKKPKTPSSTSGTSRPAGTCT